MIINKISFQTHHADSLVSLDGFTPDLTVVERRIDSGRHWLASLVRSILFHPRSLQEEEGMGIWNPECRRSIEFDWKSRRIRLSRVGGGNLRTDALSSNGQERLIDGDEHAQDLISRIDRVIYDHVYGIDFRNVKHLSSELSPLVKRFLNHVTDGSVASSRQRRQLMDDAAQVRNKIEELRQRKRRLTTDDQQTSRAQQTRRSELLNQITSHQQQQDQVQQETRNLNRRLDDLKQDLLQTQQRLQDLRAARQTEPSTAKRSQEVRQLTEQLRQLDAQICRWRKTQHNVHQQRTRLRERFVSGKLTDPLAHGRLTFDQLNNSLHDYDQLAARLNQVEQQAQRAALATSPGEKATWEKLQHNLHRLSGDLDRFYQWVCQQHLAVTRETMSAALRKRRRIERQIARHLNRLINRREQLLVRLAELDPAGYQTAIRAQQGFCHCANRDGYSAQHCPETPSIRQPSTQERELLDRCHRMEGQREDIQRQLDQNDRRLRLLADRQRAVQQQYDALPANRLKTPNQDELESLDRQIAEYESRHQWLCRQIAKHRRPERIIHPTLEQASTYLHQLSRGRFSRFAWSDETDALRVVHADRQSCSLEFLAGQELPLAYMSISLALADKLRQRGIEMPMILEQPFALLGPNYVKPFVALVREFCQRGHQVIVTTDDSEIAQTFWAQGAKVISSSIHWSLADHHFSTPLQRDPLSGNLIKTVVRQPNNSDAEEFPGELSDQVSKVSWIEPSPAPHRETDHAQTDHRPADAWDFVSNHTSDHWDLQPDKPSFENKSTPTKPVAFFDRKLSDVSIVPTWHLSTLHSLGITRVRDLLRADADFIAIALDQSGTTVDQVRQWQAQADLMCHVPNLHLFDARVLAACGIQRPREIDQLTASQLVQRVEDLLETSAGQALLRTGSDDELSRLSSWMNTMKNGRTSTEPADGSTAPSDPLPSPTPDTSSDLRLVREAENNGTPPKPMKFYLDLSSDIEAAPSIGPKTAEKLVDAGVSTVGDLLDESATTLADQLGQSRIKEDTIRRWQQQAALVCRVPNLRGHDAQLLVACDIVDPAELAAMSPQALYACIKPLAESREGAKIIRAGQKPDLQEVTDWIRWANHQRQLAAA